METHFVGSNSLSSKSSSTTAPKSFAVRTEDGAIHHVSQEDMQQLVRIRIQQARAAAAIRSAAAVTGGSRENEEHGPLSRLLADQDTNAVMPLGTGNNHIIDISTAIKDFQNNSNIPIPSSSSLESGLSFRVQTEAEGTRIMSPMELSKMVRSKIINARTNAKQVQYSFKIPPLQKQQDKTRQPGLSPQSKTTPTPPTLPMPVPIQNNRGGQFDNPNETFNRKFSWSSLDESAFPHTTDEEGSTSKGKVPFLSVKTTTTSTDAAAEAIPTKQVACVTGITPNTSLSDNDTTKNTTGSEAERKRRLRNATPTAATYFQKTNMNELIHRSRCEDSNKINDSVPTTIDRQGAGPKPVPDNAPKTPPFGSKNKMPMPEASSKKNDVVSERSPKNRYPTPEGIIDRVRRSRALTKQKLKYPHPTSESQKDKDGGASLVEDLPITRSTSLGSESVETITLLELPYSPRGSIKSTQATTGTIEDFINGTSGQTPRPSTSRDDLESIASSVESVLQRATENGDCPWAIVRSAKSSPRAVDPPARESGQSLLPYDQSAEDPVLSFRNVSRNDEGVKSGPVQTDATSQLTIQDTRFTHSLSAKVDQDSSAHRDQALSVPCAGLEQVLRIPPEKQALQLHEKSVSNEDQTIPFVQLSKEDKCAFKVEQDLPSGEKAPIDHAERRPNPRASPRGEKVSFLTESARMARRMTTPRRQRHNPLQAQMSHDVAPAPEQKLRHPSPRDERLTNILTNASDVATDSNSSLQVKRGLVAEAKGDQSDTSKKSQTEHVVAGTKSKEENASVAIATHDVQPNVADHDVSQEEPCAQHGKMMSDDTKPVIHDKTYPEPEKERTEETNKKDAVFIEDPFLTLSNRISDIPDFPGGSSIPTSPQSTTSMPTSSEMSQPLQPETVEDANDNDQLITPDPILRRRQLISPRNRKGSEPPESRKSSGASSISSRHRKEKEGLDASSHPKGRSASVITRRGHDESITPKNHKERGDLSVSPIRLRDASSFRSRISVSKEIERFMATSSAESELELRKPLYYGSRSHIPTSRLAIVPLEPIVPLAMSPMSYFSHDESDTDSFSVDHTQGMHRSRSVHRTPYHTKRMMRLPPRFQRLRRVDPSPAPPDERGLMCLSTNKGNDGLFCAGLMGFLDHEHPDNETIESVERRSLGNVDTTDDLTFMSSPEKTWVDTFADRLDAAADRFTEVFVEPETGKNWMEKIADRIETAADTLNEVLEISDTEDENNNQAHRYLHSSKRGLTSFSFSVGGMEESLTGLTTDNEEWRSH